MAAFEHRLNELERKVETLEETATQLRESTAEHRLRLENGSKVFREMRDGLEKVRAATTPQPVSALKIVAITLTVVVAGAGALWGLANMLRDRPTTEQIDTMIEAHRDAGHPMIERDIRQIREQQAVLSTKQEQIKESQAKADAKLDELLDRVPAVRTPRRRRQ